MSTKPFSFLRHLTGARRALGYDPYNTASYWETARRPLTDPYTDRGITVRLPHNSPLRGLLARQAE